MFKSWIFMIFVKFFFSLILLSSLRSFDITCILKVKINPKYYSKSNQYDQAILLSWFLQCCSCYSRVFNDKNNVLSFLISLEMTFFDLVLSFISIYVFDIINNCAISLYQILKDISNNLKNIWNQDATYKVKSIISFSPHKKEHRFLRLLSQHWSRNSLLRYFINSFLIINSTNLITHWFHNSRNQENHCQW